jgi:transaldolase
LTLQNQRIGNSFCPPVFFMGITELQLHTWGRNAKEMYDNGQDLADYASGIVVNVPCTKDGLKAAKDLVKAKIRVTMTDLSSVHQVLLAIGVGATYAAPYLHRMNSTGKP